MDGSNVKKCTLMTERGRRHVLRPVKRKASQAEEVKQITHLLFVFAYKKSPYPKHADHYTECPRQIKENNYCS